MRIKRIKSFMIDFLILLAFFFLVQVMIPKTDYVKKLEAEQNTIMEDYFAHRIHFQEYVSLYGDVFYESSLEGQIPYLLYLIFMLCYFIVLPFFWKGRTIGCYVCGVQIERFDQGPLHPWQLFIRYSIVFGLGYVFLNNLFLLLLPSSYYFICISIVAVFQFVLAIFSMMTVIFRKEKRGLHELLSNTEITKIIDKKKYEKKNQEVEGKG